MSKKTLKAAQQLHPRGMVWSAPIAMGISRNRVIEDANQALCSAMGYPRGELIGRSIQIFYESSQEFDRIGRLEYPLIARQGLGRQRDPQAQERRHGLRRDGNLRPDRS